MPIKPIKIPFNPDTMTVSELKACAVTLRGILQEFDNHCQNDGEYEWDNQGSEEFAMRVLQIRHVYEV